MNSNSNELAKLSKKRNSCAAGHQILEHKYQVNALKRLCKGCLLSKLKLENAIRYLLLARLHPAPKLQLAAVECLRVHRNELWKLAVGKIQ